MMALMTPTIVSISPVQMIISNVQYRENVYPMNDYVIILKIVQTLIVLMVLQLTKHRTDVILSWC